ncbi:MAG: chromosome partitioning protein [Alphaproteobacteria bacterium]|jgi:chromosome partitioning protein
MKVWTVVNQKGGVGKTTTAISLAGSLSAMAYKVLLIDLDPHASLTHYLGFDSEKLTLSAYDLFVASQHPHMLTKLIHEAVQKTSIDGIDLLPAHMALATLDRALPEQSGRGLIVKKIVACLQSKDTEQKLNHHYDYIVIDCQPVLGILMVNAMVAATTIVLPTQTEHLGLHGLNKMLRTIEQMKSSLSPDLVSVIVPTLFDRRVNACISAYAKMRETYKEQLWRGYIPVDTKFRDASAQGLPINRVAPNAKGSFAYEKLAGELLKHG